MNKLTQLIEKPEIRGALYSLGFYALWAMIIWLIGSIDAFKSGPCTPNLDAVSILLIGPVSFILLLINSINRAFKKKPTLYSSLIHLIGFSTWSGVLGIWS